MFYFALLMKKLLKWGVAALAAPVGVAAMLGALLYLPPVQNWAAKKAARYASEKTGMDISVGRVRLDFPLDLSLDDVRVVHEGDTIADVGEAKVDVQFLPLLKKKVEIDRLELNRVKLNTNGFVNAARVKGTVGRLALESHGIDLSGDSLLVNRARMEDARLDVALADSVPSDTSKSENRWKIGVGQLDLHHSDVTVHTPGDTLQVQAKLGDAQVREGRFDLGRGDYRVGRLDVKKGSVRYDNRFKKPVKGLDVNHLDVTDLSLSARNISACPQPPKKGGEKGGSLISADIDNVSFKEKSGIQVDRLSGHVAMDDERLRVKDLHLKTPESEVNTDVDMALNAFDDYQPGHIKATVHGSLGKQDIMRFMGDMPSGFRRKWPNYPMKIDGVVRGNMSRLNFSGLNVDLPTALKGKANGWIENLNDPARLRADVDLDVKAHDISFVKELLPADARNSFNLPKNIGLQGNFKANGNQYTANFKASEGGGSVSGKATFDGDRMAYQAKLLARNLQLQHFVPGQGLSPFTGMVDLNGQGTDLMSPRTRLTAKVKIDKFNYGGYDLAGMTADASLVNGRLGALVNSNNPLLGGQFRIGGLTQTKNGMCITLAGDFRKIDLYRLRITSEPFTVGGCGHVDICTDLKDYYDVHGYLSDLSVVNRGELFRPEDINIDLLTRRDTTHAIVDCGDFHLDMDASGGYRRLLRQTDALTAELQKQMKERYIDQSLLRSRLPNGRISLTTGRENFVMKMLSRLGYDVTTVNCEMTSSPVGGLNGQLHVGGLTVDSILVDTINLAIRSDADNMRYEAQVRNNKDNPKYVFNALFDGALHEKGTSLTARLYDEHDKLGIALGLSASMEENGIRLQSYGMDPVLGYKQFSINDDNYVFLSDDRRVSADVKLRSADGMGIQIYTDDENEEALQDITFSLHKFDLEKVLSVLPYTPSISGVLNGDYHVIQTPEDLSVSSNMTIDKFVYEHNPMGNVGAEFVYMPQADGGHYVDGILMSEGNEVATIKGTYRSSSETGDGWIDAKLGLNRIPLSMLNGFFPDQIIGLKGFGEGILDMKGSLKKPQIDGEVYLDSAYLVSVPYGVEMRFDNDPVRIANSHLLFENFQMYAHNDSPLTMAGYFDFSDLDRMYLDLKMRAENFQIINAKENPRSEAYGKAFVNFFGMMKGPVERLQMRGKLDVLGSTDMTYVLRDSPLSTDNQLDELVKFTNFNDSTEQVVTRPPISGFDMDLSMSIDEQAHIICALNADHSNYVDLIGGGDLRMQYNPADNLRLTGRYTLNNGEMKYSLPVIPLKTFTIQDGSYIEFLGDPMNPRLNITATEETKTSVSNDGSSGRIVTFDCGVVITKTLRDMGLQFIIDAPEDMTVHNELQTMSEEERGKLAVTMLTTGMYLADGNTNSFSMNSALSAFLNSQINAISGNALRTLDLSFGMDNTTTATGALHTDYSFKFAKRFWNNRLRIAIGGKVSSGAEIENQNNTFFDNVTFEYRLSQTSNKYLKLFYDRDSYDWLDGDVGQFGAGFMWKRKLQHFRDIFRFKSDKPSMPPVPQRSDSIKVKTNEENDK